MGKRDPTLIKHIMVEGVVTCRPEDSLLDVITLLDDAEISALVVVDAKGIALGVISHVDLIGYYDRDLEAARAEDILSPDIVSLEPAAPVQEAVDLMLEERIHRVFVLDAEGRPVGVLSTTDIIHDMRGSDELSV